MTTIAWDGQTLAADTLACASGLRRVAHKLFRCRRYIFGMTGLQADGHIIAQWLRDGASLRDPAPISEDGINGLVIDLDDGRVYVVEGKRATLVPVHEPVFAVGSGRDFAIAAMTFGKTAQEAVEFSARFDVYTGGEVDTIVAAEAREERLARRVAAAVHVSNDTGAIARVFKRASKNHPAPGT
jgi:hypothetical protein